MFEFWDAVGAGRFSMLGMLLGDAWGSVLGAGREVMLIDVTLLVAIGTFDWPLWYKSFCPKRFFFIYQFLISILHQYSMRKGLETKVVG